MRGSNGLLPGFSSDLTAPLALALALALLGLPRGSNGGARLESNDGPTPAPIPTACACTCAGDGEELFDEDAPEVLPVMEGACGGFLVATEGRELVCAWCARWKAPGPACVPVLGFAAAGEEAVLGF